MQHQLPWTDNIVRELVDFGIDTVEDLKLLTSPELAILFGGHKLIVKRKAKLAWENLGGREQFDFGKTPPRNVDDLPSISPTPTNPKQTQQSNRTAQRMNQNTLGSKLTDRFGFTQIVTKTKKEKEDEKKARQAKRQARTLAHATTTLIVANVVDSPHTSPARSR